MTTSLPSATSPSSFARSSLSISAGTSGGSGINRIPRFRAS
ncbi:MAG: hypothetical protein QM607_11495 [Microbacterium sp.]